MKPFSCLSIMVVAAAAVLFPQAGQADNPWEKVGKGIRDAVRQGASHRSRSGPNLSRVAEGLRNGGRDRGGWPGAGKDMDGLRDIGRIFRDSHGYNDHDRNFPFSTRNDYYRDKDDMAKAYRDVGIANAVVGLVGIMVSASQQPCYTAAPAPVPCAPSGYWERRPVVVQPQHYEQYEEWIPEIFDARTGQKLGGGYYEVRTRLVPEVIAYQDVWVTR